MEKRVQYQNKLYLLNLGEKGKLLYRRKHFVTILSVALSDVVYYKVFLSSSIPHLSVGSSPEVKNFNCEVDFSVNKINMNFSANIYKAPILRKWFGTRIRLCL